jgi:hypothetical protein
LPIMLDVDSTPLLSLKKVSSFFNLLKVLV